MKTFSGLGLCLVVMAAACGGVSERDYREAGQYDSESMETRVSMDSESTADGEGATITGADPDMSGTVTTEAPAVALSVSAPTVDRPGDETSDKAPPKPSNGTESGSDVVTGEIETDTSAADIEDTDTGEESGDTSEGSGNETDTSAADIEDIDTGEEPGDTSAADIEDIDTGEEPAEPSPYACGQSTCDPSEATETHGNMCVNGLCLAVELGHPDMIGTYCEDPFMCPVVDCSEFDTGTRRYNAWSGEGHRSGGHCVDYVDPMMGEEQPFSCCEALDTCYELPEAKSECGEHQVHVVNCDASRMNPDYCEQIVEDGRKLNEFCCWLGYDQE